MFLILVVLLIVRQYRDPKFFKDRDFWFGVICIVATAVLAIVANFSNSLGPAPHSMKIGFPILAILFCICEFMIVNRRGVHLRYIREHVQDKEEQL
jgi:magnesium-transporting ATPase (P-type)